MQREFTLVVISLLIVSALLIGFVIHATIREAMMGGGYQFGRISAYEVMSDVRYDLIVRVSLVLFITILLIAVFGIMFLHRVAGPVYRFRSILRKVSQGEIPEEFHLRAGDFFTETADDLNGVLRVLRERRERIQTLRGKIDRALLENATQPLARVLKELKEEVDRIP
jgi:nitrogen fixation/metabolism regulation signal transduction histidine kinase